MTALVAGLLCTATAGLCNVSMTLLGVCNLPRSFWVACLAWCTASNPSCAMQEWFTSAITSGHETGQWEWPQGRFGTCPSLHQGHCAQEEVWQCIAWHAGQPQGVGSGAWCFGVGLLVGVMQTGTWRVGQRVWDGSGGRGSVVWNGVIE